MPWFERRWFALILALYLLVGGAYAVFTPSWQAPDEPAHYNYVAELARTGRLPVLTTGDYPADYLEQIKAARFPAHMSIAPIRYEAWQPPLYYVLAAPIFRLTGGALLPLRLFSLLLGVGSVVCAYLIARRFFPHVPGFSEAVAGLVAFVPMHLAMLAAINNDALTELLIAVVACRLCLALDREKVSWRFLLVTGVLLGLGLVTKATVYYVGLPLAILWLLLASRGPESWARRSLALLGPALAVALPWWVRNVIVYGWPDLLGKINHDRVVLGQLRTLDMLAQVGWPEYLRQALTTTFHSFWGQFGWMAVPMDRRTYLALAVLTAWAIVGLIARAWGQRHELGPDWRESLRNRSGVVFLGAWCLLAVGGYMAYNLTYVQFQGRYLFPALIPLAILACTGWRWCARRAGWLACALPVVLVCGLDVVTSGPDKWSLLAGASVVGLCFLRRRLPQRWALWYPALPVVAVAALAFYSLPAFVIPNL